MTAKINKLFPIYDANFRAWRDKSIEELYKMQEKLISRMERMDGNAAMGLYQQFENTLAQLDMMIERKQKEQQDKANAEANKPYNQR